MSNSDGPEINHSSIERSDTIESIDAQLCRPGSRTVDKHLPTLRDFQKLLFCLCDQCSVLLPNRDIGDDTLRDALRGHFSNFFHPWRHKNVSDLVCNALLNPLLWKVLHDFLLQRDFDDLVNVLDQKDVWIRTKRKTDLSCQLALRK